ncbi:MAG: Lpg1974 family pore-forming outer membrane protein [Pirellulales bacterium]
MKGAVIDQTIRARWSDPLLGISAEENVDHDYWGLGPSFGVGFRYGVPEIEGLSVVGSFSAALLYGRWNVEDAYRRTDGQPPLFAFDAFTTRLNDSALGTPTLTYFLGIEWTRPGAIATTFNAGFESQWWANQQRLPTFQQLPMHGDLTLQGLTCGLSFCF